MLSASGLGRRVVIDAATAEKLGYVGDIEIDMKTGVIQSVIVPKRDSLLSFFKRLEYVIPWENITAIGNDVILVNVNDSLIFPTKALK